MTRGRRRSRRVRAAAGLGALAAALPLMALPSAGPAAALPTRVLSSVADDTCTTKTSALVNKIPPGLEQLGGPSANTVATGKGILVAVVDSGVADNVHFPAGTVLPGRDVTQAGTANGRLDLVGHGTAIAGEIAARRVKGSGVVGLAPEARILPIRAYTKEAEDIQPGEKQYPPTVDGIAVGIQAAAAGGAKIINVSMSTTDNTVGLQRAVAYATAKGALIVASAGNRQKSENKSDIARYPAANPEVLAVAAVDSNGTVTDDSIHGSYVDVAAPGVDILTTYHSNGDCLISTQYASTSYATAYVSAAAALIAQAHPDETPAQWRYRLEATALRVRPDTRDDKAGWGIIQPYEALTYISDGTGTGPQDPAVTTHPTAPRKAQLVDPGVRQVADHTTRDQTLWLTLGGVVVVLALALGALLRRDRKARVRPGTKTPAGVR